MHCAVNLPLIHTHVLCLSPIDFHSSSLQSTYPTLQLLFYPFLALAADHNVICKHRGPWSFLSDIIRHPIHYHGKHTMVQSLYLVQFHLHLEPFRHSYRKPHRCCTVLVHIVYNSLILTCQSRLSHAIPHVFSWHLVISFLQIQIHTMWLLLYFPMNTLKSNNASVVIFPGMKPYCCSLNVKSRLNLLSTNLSHSFMV